MRPPVHPAKRLLFATDLSPACFRILQKNADFLESLGAEIILFHKLPDPAIPVVQSGFYLLGGGWVPFHELFPGNQQALQDACETELARWCDWLRARGLHASFRFDPTPGPIAEAIVQKAHEEGSPWICIATHAGPIAAKFLGTMVNPILHASDLPLLILHMKD